MDTECQKALALSKSLTFKVTQGVKIVINVVGILLLLVLLVKVKNNKKMGLLHFNLRFIIICHYVFVFVNSITMTVMVLLDFARLTKDHNDPCDYLIPIWVAFLIRSTCSLCVLGETLTIAFISIERIIATFVQNYDSTSRKIVPIGVFVVMLSLLIGLLYIWCGTLFPWNLKIASFNFRTDETAPFLQVLAIIILGLELISIVYYHIMYVFNKRDYNRQIRLEGAQKSRMLKSLSEKYKMEETRRTVEFLLPIVWIHFFAILLNYTGFLGTYLIFKMKDFVEEQIIYEVQALHIFYPVLLSLVGLWQIKRRFANIVDIAKTEKERAVDQNELYYQRMNELFQSGPFQNQSKK